MEVIETPLHFMAAWSTTWYWSAACSRRANQSYDFSDSDFARPARLLARNPKRPTGSIPRLRYDISPPVQPKTRERDCHAGDRRQRRRHDLPDAAGFRRRSLRRVQRQYLWPSTASPSRPWRCTIRRRRGHRSSNWSRIRLFSRDARCIGPAQRYRAIVNCGTRRDMEIEIHGRGRSDARNREIRPGPLPRAGR